MTRLFGVNGGPCFLHCRIHASVFFMSYKIFEDHALEYDQWFERHSGVYRSEIAALRGLFDPRGVSLEVGAGTGRFSLALGVRYGIEPARAMAELARKRGLKVVQAVAESLPLAAGSVDSLLMVTTVCFLDDIQRAFEEVRRVLRPSGLFVIGEIDRTSALGRMYDSRRPESVFYREARFYSPAELVELLRIQGFKGFAFRQTVFHLPEAGDRVEPVREGFGQGAFVSIRAFRPE